MVNGRKLLKGIGIAFLVLVISSLFITSFLHMTNASSLHDSDLIYVRPDISAASNAFGTLEKATNKLYWPDKQWEELGNLSDDIKWNDSQAAQILETNQAALDLFDEAMQRPFLLVPESKTFDDSLSYLGAWKELALLNSIRIISLHRQQKDQEAFKRALELINFGQRIENCGGVEIHYLTGSAIKEIGLFRIRKMTADTGLSEDDLTQWIHKLDGFGPNLEGLTNSIKVEYRIQSHMFDDYARGSPPGTTNSFAKRFLLSIGMIPIYSAPRTKMDIVEDDRALFSNLSKPFAEMTWSDCPDSETNSSVYARLASGNALGGILAEMLQPVARNIASCVCREKVDLTGTQLMIALKVYKMQQGKLPESLSELVPEFFPRVPTDDFDGKSFHYLPDKKLLYSVGPCLKDLGGRERKNNSNDYNLSFKIDF